MCGRRLGRRATTQTYGLIWLCGASSWTQQSLCVSFPTQVILHAWTIQQITNFSNREVMPNASEAPRSLWAGIFACCLKVPVKYFIRLSIRLFNP